MARMMHVVINKDPREWTKEERMFVMLNRYEYIEECLKYYEREKENRKLLNFLESKKNVTS